MRSTFMGLETSKRGMFTQQSALYTTGHNIANANTEGYTRQRVNMQATLPYPSAGLNQPVTPGYIGTGVEAESVQRMRNQFIDQQYRQETNKLSYWESRTDAIDQMEDIMKEPSENGINKAFSLFWQSLQDVGAKPDDPAARRVAIARAEHLAESFNYMDTQLKQIQNNIGNEINVATNQMNTILGQIASINKQVMDTEPNGYVPNDLYDKRDVLIDKLNEFIPVTVERVGIMGANSIAEGYVKISFKTNNGESIELVNGKDFAAVKANGVKGTEIIGNDIENVFSQLDIYDIGDPPDLTSSPNTVVYEDFDPSKGKLLGMIESYGYEDAAGNTKGNFPEMLAKLDQLAETFVKTFNDFHKAGFDLNSTSTTVWGTPPSPGSGNDFFEGTSASDIKVTNALLNDPKLLAAASKGGEEGNGKWAQELANLQTRQLSSVVSTVTVGDATATYGGSVNLDKATVQTFYERMVGQLAVDGQEAKSFKENSEALHLTVANNRDSISKVSLDEEMTNMIMFQQAYNANARMITVIDEVLDRIINGMGR